MSFREKTSTRRDFKSGLNAEELRHKRAEHAVTLRKQEREEQLSRRRRQNTDDDEADAISHEPPVLDLSALGHYVSLLDGSELSVVEDAVKKIRQMLSLEKNPPISEVIQFGGVPKLIRLLMSNYGKIPFEAAWALTNIASGTSEHTKAVVDAGAIPLFVNLLESSDDEVRDQAVWALGNISGESPAYRDSVLSFDAMPKLLRIAHSQVKLCMLRNIAWTLSNFCRGKNPHPNFSIISTALPTLYNMIHFDDDDVVADACWALSYISDDTGSEGLPENFKIESVISAGVVPRLVQLLSHPSHHVKTPALRAIGNVVTGNNMQTQIVLNENVLTPLISLLANQRRSIRKEACWTISNITAGTTDQILTVLRSGAFHALMSLAPAADVPIKKEIAWAFSNAFANEDPLVTPPLLESGVVAVLRDMMHAQDAQLQLVLLDCVEHILVFGQKTAVDGVNRCLDLLEESGVVTLLENLQQSASDAVYTKAHHIIVTFFTDVDIEDSAPGVNDDGTFQFQGQQDERFDF